MLRRILRFGCAKHTLDGVLYTGTPQECNTIQRFSLGHPQGRDEPGRAIQDPSIPPIFLTRVKRSRSFFCDVIWFRQKSTFYNTPSDTCHAIGNPGKEYSITPGEMSESGQETSGEEGADQ